MSRDGGYLALTITGDSMWGEWAKGYCLNNDEAGHFEFIVNAFARYPLLQIAPEEPYLVVESQSRTFAVWNIYTRTQEQIFSITDHLKMRPFIATEATESLPVVAVQSANNQVTIHRGKMMVGRLTLESNIYYGAFYPNTQYIALLLETNEILFYDWQSNRQKAKMRLI